MPAGKDFLDLGKQGLAARWRYGLGLIVVMMVWLFGSALAFFPILVMRFFQIRTNETPFSKDIYSLNDLNKHIPAVIMFAGITAGFFFLILGLGLVLKVLHARSLTSLITPYPRFNWRRFALGVALWLLLSALGSLFEALLYPGRYQYALNLPDLLVVLPVALVMTPIQTTAEELLVRGYLAQMTGRFTRRFLLPLIAPSLIFMALHAGNLEVRSGWGWMFAFYFGFGALLSFMTLKDNTLELALGVHAANNLFAFLFANYVGGSIISPSFFTVQTLDVTYGFIAFLIQALLLCLVLFVLPQPKWLNWTNKRIQ